MGAEAEGAAGGPVLRSVAPLGGRCGRNEGGWCLTTSLLCCWYCHFLKLTRLNALIKLFVAERWLGSRGKIGCFRTVAQHWGVSFLCLGSPQFCIGPSFPGSWWARNLASQSSLFPPETKGSTSLLTHFALFSLIKILYGIKQDINWYINNIICIHVYFSYIFSVANSINT